MIHLGASYVIQLFPEQFSHTSLSQQWRGFHIDLASFQQPCSLCLKLQRPYCIAVLLASGTGFDDFVLEGKSCAKGAERSTEL